MVRGCIGALARSIGADTFRTAARMEFNSLRSISLRINWGKKFRSGSASAYNRGATRDSKEKITAIHMILWRILSIQGAGKQMAW